jgi:hypothetical protein
VLKKGDIIKEISISINLEITIDKNNDRCYFRYIDVSTLHERVLTELKAYEIKFFAKRSESVGIR